MTEEERVVREKIANIIDTWLSRPCYDSANNPDNAIPIEDALLDMAGQILSIPELCILHPDQSLPSEWAEEYTEELLLLGWRRVILPAGKERDD